MSAIGISAGNFIILCKNQDQAKQCLEFTSEKLDNMLLTLDEANLVNFEQGFEYLGVMFVRSLIMTPFDKPKKERKVLSVPEPLNMNIYMLKKKKGW